MNGDDYPLTRRHSGEKDVVAPTSNSSTSSSRGRSPLRATFFIGDSSSSSSSSSSKQRQRGDNKYNKALRFVRNVCVLSCVGLVVLGILYIQQQPTPNFIDGNVGLLDVGIRPVEDQNPNDRKLTECKFRVSYGGSVVMVFSNGRTAFPHYIHDSYLITRSIPIVLSTMCCCHHGVARTRWDMGSTIVVTAISWIWNFYNTKHSSEGIDITFPRCDYDPIP
jgi:hypothetical protein